MLFTCFVDFSKAFDCVPRNKLFDKIESVGVKGNFLSIIKSMYEDDSSAIKKDGLVTESFRCYSGVKQGCMLSPTLFNLYLSDLSSVLKQTDISDPINIAEGSPLNCLLYADDLLLLSKNPGDLQLLLNRLMYLTLFTKHIIGILECT